MVSNDLTADIAWHLKNMAIAKKKISEERIKIILDNHGVRNAYDFGIAFGKNPHQNFAREYLMELFR